ncbi:hypothetical protein MKJ01_02715 [Chryseobacterium sp. SSA4.19]|uniref:hypothetical protein n=1 Tax=Chryseobacterium sp. SSA4.19 TaxID=2919915 RepID=UPI001F4EC1FF|nr:hypothetical protein [Chryseobacterium sp. SSA4.19]MCJ8152674.1 hypothetical protein [Chryseobacterium sp. SSA4.19]
MNTFLKAGILLGFSMMSASLMSKDRDFSVSVGNITAKTVHFEVSNAKNISLFIYNDTEGELYSENLNTEGSITKSYDLQALAPGTYYLVAESETKVEKYKINIGRNNNITMEKTPVASVSKPEFTVSDHMVTLHMADVENPVHISVSDASNTVYYAGNKIAVDGTIDMAFDLNRQTSDTYIIKIEQAGNIFNKVISFK